MPTSLDPVDHDTIRERRQDISTSSNARSESPQQEVPADGDRAGVDSHSYIKTRGMPHFQFWLLATGISLGLFLSMLDTSIVATSLYTIGEDLRSTQIINWVALAYTLSYLGCAVAFARLSDVIGRRNTFFAAYTLFFSCSLACGFAPDLRQLIMFRTGQGIGGSGLYSLTMIILPELCPRQFLQHIGSLIGFVIAAAGVLGPILGGLLTKHAGWRWVFWINGPIGCISIVLFALCWPRNEHLPRTRKRSWKELDFAGTFLLMASVTLVIYAFQNVGESALRSWASLEFVAPMAAGVFCGVILLLWEVVVEKWLKDHLAPAFPVGLFRNHCYTAAALSTLFLGFPYLLLVFSFPVRAQVVSGKDALMAGVILLPMLGATALGSVISGRVNTAQNHLFETMTIGACLMALSCGLLTTVSGPQDDFKALGFLSLAGLGFGLSTAAATILVTVEAPTEEHAPAHGILAQMRVFGGSLGISTSTILVQAKMRHHVSGILSQQFLTSLRRGFAHLPPKDLDSVREAYTLAFQEGTMIAAAVSGAAIFLALCGFRRGPKGMKVETQDITRQRT